MTIKVAQDYGSAALFNGQAYYRVNASPVPGHPNYNYNSESDSINHEPFLFGYDDDDLSGGGNHRNWTACEICVANLPQHSGSWAWVDAEWYFLSNFNPVPYNGVFRFWWNLSNTSGRIKVNGGPEILSRATISESVAVRLTAGDVVETQGVNPSTCFYIFLPYVWPAI